MLGDRWIGWDSVVHTHVFSLTALFRRERIEALLAVNILGHILVPLCWQRMSWEPGILGHVLIPLCWQRMSWKSRSEDQQKVVRVWVVMRNWLGDP
jgi:hypothetical protein